MQDELIERKAIWSAIQSAANMLCSKCQIYVNKSTQKSDLLVNQEIDVEIETWRLFECLALLAILAKADSIKTSKITNCFRKTGPIHFVEDNKDRYV